MTTADLMMSLLPEHLERAAWSAARIEEHRRQALRRTLVHAKTHSPFYAQRLAHVDAGHFEIEDLATLPVLTKDEMMACFDDFVTDRRVTKKLAEEHLGTTGEHPSWMLGEYLVLASGGSSGVRGMFVYDRRSAAEYTLAGVRGSVARLLSDPARTRERVHIGMVAAASAVHATRALPELFSGSIMDITSIPATLPLDEIVRRLEELQPRALHGYPTIVAMLADEKVAGRLSIAPDSITTSSEPLTTDLRERIERGFGVGATDQFGASEGVMGSSVPGSSAIVMPADLVIFEFVDAESKPVPPGTESAKVLLTTLYNPVQPLIRYELSDRMTQLVDPRAMDGHPRVVVSGRSDDLLRYDGAVVHPHAIRSVLVHTPAVREYQVRQTDGGVDLDVVPNAGSLVDTVDLATRVERALNLAGLPHPRVVVKVTEAIARDERSGKVRRIVPRKQEEQGRAARQAVAEETA